MQGKLYWRIPKEDNVNTGNNCKEHLYNINKKFPQFDKSIITPEKAKKEILKFISSSKN